MKTQELRARQAPLKDRYREDPGSALVTLSAEGELDVTFVACRVPTFNGEARSGLHPATGGDGNEACSGDMLLQALVACAGVTLGAVATAMGIEIHGGKVRAEGEIDFRGTLGVSREVPVGFTGIRLLFALDTDAAPERLHKLMELTERYCVVFQTLRSGLEVTCSLERQAQLP